jgi:hypothetical protein
MSSDDRRLYNPSRDVAHNFQAVLHLVADRLEDRSWPELAELLDREGVTLDDLGEACGSYCLYVASAAQTPEVSMPDALRASGFFQCKPAAQVAVMAALGTCFSGIQHAGIREATIGGEGPLYTVNDLLGHAERFRAQLGQSRWRRRWERFKSRCLAGVAAVRGK